MRQHRGDATPGAELTLHIVYIYTGRGRQENGGVCPEHKEHPPGRWHGFVIYTDDRWRGFL